MQFMICNKLDKTQRRIFTVVPRAKLPIEYVMEYNVADVAGTKFATNQNSRYSSALVNWQTAYNRFYPGNNRPIEGIYCHLPYYQEFWAICAGTLNSNYTYYNASYSNLSETIRVRNSSKNYYSDGTTASNIHYAIRFRSRSSHDNYRCAYKYEWLGSSGSWNQKMRVTVRYLGPNQTGVTTSTINNASWWNNNKQGDIVREFPVTGAYSSNTTIEGPSAQGNWNNDYVEYWSTYSSGGYSCILWIYGYNSTNNNCYVYNGQNGWTIQSYARPVRLFSDY